MVHITLVGSFPRTILSTLRSMIPTAPGIPNDSELKMIEEEKDAKETRAAHENDC
jgi:hypothetical protein